MKTIKILLPVAMTFAMFMGMNTSNAQSAYAESISHPIIKIASNLIPKKTIGLDYTQSLIEINNALTKGVKSDYTIDFQGKVMVSIALDENGIVQSVTFDKDITGKLKASIKTALKSAPIAPVHLNGKAKAQTFRIPLIIT